MNRRYFIRCALAVVVGATPSTRSWPQAGGAAGRRFEDAGAWSERFDNPARDAWQKPAEVIAALGLARNAIVADIGAGTGYFAARLARAVPEGRVYAADLEPEMVAFLAQRAQRESIANMRAVQASREDPKLPEPVDLILLVNVQGLMVDPGDYFARLKHSLKPGARIAIISTRIDAPSGARREMRVAPDKVKNDMARQGYALIAEHDFLPHQFFLVFAARS